MLQLLTYLGPGKVPSAKQVLRTAWFGRCMVYSHTSGRRLKCTTSICKLLLLTVIGVNGLHQARLQTYFWGTFSWKSLQVANINTIKQVANFVLMSMLPPRCLNHMVDEPPSPHGRQTSRKPTEENQQHILEHRCSLMLHCSATRYGARGSMRWFWGEMYLDVLVVPMLQLLLISVY